MVNVDLRKVEEAAIEKAKKATVLFSKEYKIEIIPAKSEQSPSLSSKSPRKKAGKRN